jgi:cyclopropane fatty-acyl-phospholipid synthase-like methyltransferase
LGDWERFASSDPYFYIATDTGLDLRSESGRRQFFQIGEATAQELSGQVAADVPGHSLAIEIGCGVGRLLLSVAGEFETVRGVDVAPTMLKLLGQIADERGIANVQAYLPNQPWDEPAGTADYAYSFLVFQHIEREATIRDYLKRISSALRPGGIAQLQFDCRPQTHAYRVRPFIPDWILPRTQRHGIRRIRRDAAWVREAVAAVGLSIVRERSDNPAEHWFVLRR